MKIEYEQFDFGTEFKKGSMVAVEKFINEKLLSNFVTPMGMFKMETTVGFKKGSLDQTISKIRKL